MITFQFKYVKLKTVVHAVLFAAVLLKPMTPFAAEIKMEANAPLAMEAGSAASRAIATGSSDYFMPAAKGITPEVRFQDELNRLVPAFSIDVDGLDTVVRLEEAINRGTFAGLKSWSYEGVRNGDQITLKWEVEWFDEHAVLMAYENQALSAKLTKKQLALLEKCRGVMSSEITPSMTDYEKQLAIHEYIVLNCMFDSDLEKSPNVTGEEDGFFAYGALINGKAVCAGYAEAAKLLLDMAGIDNYRLDSAEHSWNLVKIEGEYYHMDLAWDDPVPDVPGRVLYDYFNLTDAQVMGYRSHDWLNKEIYPKATATKYNYFAYNNLAADNHGDVKRLLINAVAARYEQVTIIVSDDLINDPNWNERLRFLTGLPFKESSITKYSYSPPNKNKHTLTVVFNH